MINRWSYVQNIPEAKLHGAIEDVISIRKEVYLLMSPHAVWKWYIIYFMNIFNPIEQSKVGLFIIGYSGCL